MLFPKPVRIRLKGKKLKALRLACFTRDKFRCVDCSRVVTWESGEMAHIVSKRLAPGDAIENVLTKCHRCHMAEHGGGSLKDMHL